MKTLEDFKKQYFIFTGEHQMQNEHTIDGYDDNKAMIMIERGEIIEKPLSKTLNKYGQQISPEDAGDYTINNPTCDALRDCTDELTEDFNLELSGAIIHNNFSQLPEKLKLLVDNWRNENEVKNMCGCYEFWDGSNYRSVIFYDEGYHNNNIDEVDDVTYRKICKEMFKNGKEVLDYEEVADFIDKAETKNFIFLWQRRLGTYGVKIWEK